MRVIVRFRIHRVHVFAAAGDVLVAADALQHRGGLVAVSTAAIIIDSSPPVVRQAIIIFSISAL